MGREWPVFIRNTTLTFTIVIIHNWYIKTFTEETVGRSVE